MLQQLIAASSVIRVCLLKTEGGQNTFSEQGITCYLSTRELQLRGDNHPEQRIAILAMPSHQHSGSDPWNRVSLRGYRQAHMEDVMELLMADRANECNYFL